MGVSAEEGTEHGSEYMTNLIIANVETLSHDDSHSYSFSSDGHQFGGAWPLAPLWIRHCALRTVHRAVKTRSRRDRVSAMARYWHAAEVLRYFGGHVKIA